MINFPFFSLWDPVLLKSLPFKSALKTKRISESFVLKIFWHTVPPTHLRIFLKFLLLFFLTPPLTIMMCNDMKLLLQSPIRGSFQLNWIISEKNNFVTCFKYLF